MDFRRYREILGEFSLLLEAGGRISSRLVGFETNVPHLKYADPIFTKLLAHAISLRRLSPQLDGQISVELWDMPSACAVARCLIEAHDVLEYIAFATLPNNEQTFRLLVWNLHDQQRRSHMLQSMRSKNPEAVAIHGRVSTLQKEVEAHALFLSLDKSVQLSIRKGDAPAFLISQRERNAAIGVDHSYHKLATMALSQYVHTLPMSVHQLFEFKAGTPEALRLSSMPLQYSLGFLARAIERMVEVFPSGAVDVSEEYIAVSRRWRGIVEGGLQPT